jgi:hypothetical protein
VFRFCIEHQVILCLSTLVPQFAAYVSTSDQDSTWGTA